MSIDGDSFFTALLQQAIALCSVAERQQGQGPQPDARLAVVHCLQATYLRACSGLPFEPAPPQCITLVEVASRVLASFAAVPEAASAASVLLPPISRFLSGPLSDSAQKCGQKLNKARRSLLASVELLLEGPELLLSAACVAARGPVLVGEAAALVFHAVTIALWASGFSMTAGESRLAARLLQQCVVLLSDPTIATQLVKQHCYPICSLETMQEFPTHLEYIAEGATISVLSYICGLNLSTVCMKARMKILAENQQQLLALSAAVARAARKYGSKGGLRESFQLPTTTVYEVVALLAGITGFSAETLSENPALVCQPAGLAATLASAAMAALAFAAVDSSCGNRPQGISDELQGCMQYAAHAAKYLHVLSQQLLKPSRTIARAARTALLAQGAAQ